MRVKIKLFGSHAHRAGIQSGREIQRVCSNTATVSDLLKELDIGDTSATVSVNGTIKKSDHILLEGDYVSIYDLLEGG